MLRSSLNMQALLQEAAALRYTADGTGAMMAFGQFNRPKLPRHLQTAVDEIRARFDHADYLAVMVNILPPGLHLPLHRDPMPNWYPYGGRVQRWHLCIQGENSWLEEGSERVFMPDGCWYGPLHYWNEHRAGNDGKVDRVHLIVDLASPA